MCATYKSPDTRMIERIWEIKRTNAFDREWKADIYPGYYGPVIRLQDDEPVWDASQFGLIPQWCKPEDAKKRQRNTYNARTETVDTLASYKTAWKYRRFCIAPAPAFYEWRYEEAVKKPAKWRIGRKDGKPVLIAGIHNTWRNAATDESFNTFSMLTINADGNKVMEQFHAPGDEKRMVVMLHDDQVEDWLRAPDHDVARTYFNQYPADLLTAEKAEVA